MTTHTRAELVARWLHVTRVVLPAMADAQRWPIRLDHCFMRVMLDHAVGGRWDLEVRRPAIRFMPLPELHRAIILAETVAADPARLPAMNAQSLAWRRHNRPVQRRDRAGAAGGTRGGT